MHSHYLRFPILKIKQFTGFKQVYFYNEEIIQEIINDNQYCEILLCRQMVFRHGRDPGSESALELNWS